MLSKQHIPVKYAYWLKAVSGSDYLYEKTFLKMKYIDFIAEQLFIDAHL